MGKVSDFCWQSETFPKSPIPGSLPKHNVDISTLANMYALGVTKMCLRSNTEVGNSGGIPNNPKRIDLKLLPIINLSQCTERISNKIANPLNETFKGLKCMLQGFRICFA